MAYAEITENKTVSVSRIAGTITLDSNNLYAGNKNKTTGSIVGNANKNTLEYYFDPETSWITSVIFNNCESDNTDTAKSITVIYSANNTLEERSVILKLKNMAADAKYITIKLMGRMGGGDFVIEEPEYITMYFGTNTSYSSVNINDTSFLNDTTCRFTNVSGTITYNDTTATGYKTVSNNTTVSCKNHPILLNMEDGSSFDCTIYNTISYNQHMIRFIAYSDSMSTSSALITQPITKSNLTSLGITKIICFAYNFNII